VQQCVSREKKPERKGAKKSGPIYSYDTNFVLLFWSLHFSLLCFTQKKTASDLSSHTDTHTQLASYMYTFYTPTTQSIQLLSL
jgi:hypothetical protein